MPTPDLPKPLPPFKSVTYAGHAPGPRLVVTGGVHGNETCGTAGISQVMAEIDRGEQVIVRGTVTFVPVANPLARMRGQRCGDRNLNRGLGPVASADVREFEDLVANWLCPLLAAHDVLLDLHSFSAADGQPFVLVGPPDNDGPLEPFSHAAQEEALARRLGVGRAVHGWLRTYADGVDRRLRRLRGRQDVAAEADPSDAGEAPSPALDLDWRRGVGTTEYMRQRGGWGVTLECGSHADPHAPRVAAEAIRRTLAHLGLVDAPPPPASRLDALRLDEVVDRLHPGDRWIREWKPFDRVEAGELLGHRHDGTPLHATHTGRIVFPNVNAGVDEEWYYLARDSDRFGPALRETGGDTDILDLR